MTVLVTGGCGFIGSHLAHALVAEGKSVRILDNLSSGHRANAPKEAELMIGDITNETDMMRAINGASEIYHLAAIASVQLCTEQWVKSHQTNLTGTIMLLDAAAKSPLKPSVVYASSAAVYGDNPLLPLSETNAATPLSSYGLDKLSCEHYARIAHASYGVSSVGLRFFNVYGQRQDPNSPYSGVISRFVKAAMGDGKISIFGDGGQSRDFIYVGDIIALLKKAMRFAPSHCEIINGCTGIGTSLLALVQAIESATRKTLATQYLTARAGDIRHSRGNAKKASDLLGFSASTSLLDGLKATLAESSSAVELRHA